MPTRRHKVTVAMLGARMHYAVPRILNDAGMLERLYTDSYIGNKPLLERALKSLPDRLRRGNVDRLIGRKETSIPATRVTSFDRMGIAYALARRGATDVDARAAVYDDFNAQFNHAVVRRGFGGADTVWGFNTACAGIFRSARDEGLTRIVEQTILPGKLEHQLLRNVAEEWPGWQPGLRLAANPHESSEPEEWELADRIVAGSAFVAEGLEQLGVARSKISVIPYGVDTSRFSPATTWQPDDGPLRVLFVGEVGLRKGAPYLLEALHRLGPRRVEARFVGGIALDPGRLGRYADVAEFLGPVPRVRMPELFRWADVFALPSIVEGSATVTYEALMSGLPVVTTANAGSIVRNGESGWIVPVQNTAALVQALEHYCDDRTLLARHRDGALAARLEADVRRYAKDLLKLFEPSGKK